MDGTRFQEQRSAARCRRGRLTALLLVGGLLFALKAKAVQAQATDSPTVSSNGSSYIDNAIPGCQLRFRYDSARNLRQPNRAEFFWAQGQPGGPGLPLPERSVDYQDLMNYVELAWGEQPLFSAFFEVPVRFLNPEVNANAGGVGDVNAGFKYALLRTDDLVVTSQLRVYAPTGDAGRGLGVRHVSLEPALLVFWPLSEQFALQGELRYWVPAGGTDFAGDIIRYGVGAQYELFRGDHLRVLPVAEVVGWAVLGGKESMAGPAGPGLVQAAGGEGILIGLVGLRLGCGPRADVSATYGRALTGDRWYEDAFRLELRWRY